MLSSETSVSRERADHFIWPIGRSFIPDEMNTSYGPRIDEDEWDFHDGIDLPAAVGTPVYASADGVVHRAGPADQGFHSTHVVLRVVDPTDGKDDLFLFHLHLNSIADGVIQGAEVNQGDLIGTVGQEDATYPHLHFEFRKGGDRQRQSVHPLNYLTYLNAFNFTQPRLDRVNFYLDDGRTKSAIRVRFDGLAREEGDLRGVNVELSGREVATRTLHVDFDDRETINSNQGEQHAFKNGIAVEGYQKSNLKGEGLGDLHYGVIINDIEPEYEVAELQVLDVKHQTVETAQFPLPRLDPSESPVASSEDFEGQIFPPAGWDLSRLDGNVCRPDATAALQGQRGLLCQDLESSSNTLIRAGLRFALPAQRMSWRLRARIKPQQLTMNTNQVIHPLAFLAGDTVVAATCLQKSSDDKFVAGVLIRRPDGSLRQRINERRGVSRSNAVTWELELLRIGTRQSTAVLRLGNTEVARINGETRDVEPDSACVGILHTHTGLKITLYVDQIRMMEAPRF